MKLLLVSAILLISQVALTAVKTFDLQMSLAVDGKLVSSPSITVQEGKKGVITQEANGEKSFIEVVAQEVKTENGSDAVSMSFVVGKYESNGQKIILSKPQIMALYDHKAEITVGANQQPKILSLTVVAKKSK